MPEKMKYFIRCQKNSHDMSEKFLDARKNKISFLAKYCTLKQISLVITITKFYSIKTLSLSIYLSIYIYIYIYIYKIQSSSNDLSRAITFTFGQIPLGKV